MLQFLLLAIDSLFVFYISDVAPHDQLLVTVEGIALLTLITTLLIEVQPEDPQEPLNTARLNTLWNLKKATFRYLI